MNASVRANSLLKMTASMAKAVEVEDVYETLVDRLAEAVSASSAGLWLRDTDGGAALLARSYGYTARAAECMATLPGYEVPGVPALDALRAGVPVWIASQAELLGRYPELASKVSPERAYRVLCLPLMGSQRALGVLALTIEADQRAPDDERNFLLLVARYATEAMERLGLVEAQRICKDRADAAAKRITLISRASTAFNVVGSDPEECLRSVAAELSAALGSSINITLESDGLLHVAATHHPIEKAHVRLLQLSQGEPVRLGEGVTGTIAATGESVLISPLASELDLTHAPAAYRSFLKEYPTYGLIGAALRIPGRTIGTVTAARIADEHPFDDDDLTLLEQLAQPAAAAIENARFHHETVNARMRSEHLYQFAQAVVASERMEVVFDAALDVMQTAVGAARAAILTFDDKGVMRLEAWRRLSAQFRSAEEGHSPWAREAIAPRPVVYDDTDTDHTLASYHRLFHEEGIGAAAFIPLVADGSLIGRLVVYHDGPHRFGTREMETAVGIGHHLVSVITRLSAMKRLEDEIRRNELFIGVLAHDLRTPLDSILMGTQILLIRNEQGPASNDMGRPLGRILASGKRMANMVDQLMDLTRSRSGGGIEIAPRPVDLADICRQTIAEIETSRPGAQIQCEATGDQHGRWDPDRISQVLSNLLRNAREHGDSEAGIAVTLDGRKLDQVTVVVHNWGAIPAEEMPHLFDLFRSTRKGRNRSRGLGLGLFIVREVLRAHGGSVAVTSSEQAGTSFVVRLPRAAN